jgi:hypothetical protein
VKEIEVCVCEREIEICLKDGESLENNFNFDFKSLSLLIN